MSTPNVPGGPSELATGLLGGIMTWAADKATGVAEVAGDGANTTLRTARRVVSGNRMRFQDGDFDLDLNYVTDRILSMGLPSEGVEAMYRNPIDEVVRFFKEKHGLDHCRIYNLCEERTYDYEKFDFRVREYRMPDHETTRLVRLIELCNNATDWLNTDPDNVVAVHCKGGKGRTGLVVSCLLLHLDYCKTAQEALSFFANKRTKEGSDFVGVQGASQLRYVHYYDRVIREGLLGSGIPEPTVFLTSITLSGLSVDYVPTIRVFANRDVHTFTNEMVAAGEKLTIQLNNLKATGELTVRGSESGLVVDGEFFFFYLHTYFLPGEGRLVLTKGEVDIAHKDTSHKKYPPQFSVELAYLVATEEDDNDIDSDDKSKKNPPELPPRPK